MRHRDISSRQEKLDDSRPTASRHGRGGRSGWCMHPLDLIIGRQMNVDMVTAKIERIKDEMVKGQK